MGSNFGFHFERSSRGRTHGDKSAEEEHFKGMKLAEALARELGQNSIDARANDENAVRLVLELAKMNTSSIPDFENLKNHIKWADKATRSKDGKQTRLQRAGQEVEKPTVPVLRISDYGTVGLKGSESNDDQESPLFALTRGAGISVKRDGGGGSFGIGSAVGPLASTLHTVLWTSLAEEAKDVVFAGYSQLATHADENKNRYEAAGLFMDLDLDDDVRYLRNPAPVGPFAMRTSPGTDTYILGYEAAEEDPELLQIRDAFCKNFFAAIFQGNLIVEGRSPNGTWKLSGETLEEHVRHLDEVRPFVEALQDESPTIREIPYLGEVKLLVRFDDQLPKKLHTVAMRSPLMRIKEYSSTAIQAKYAAVFICENPVGNELLRSLEAPSHDNWQTDRTSGGEKVHKAIRKFILDSLRARIKTEVGKEIKIEGLEKYLPVMNFARTSESLQVKGGTPSIGEPDKQESARVSGHRKQEAPETNSPVRRAAKVHELAYSPGDNEIDQGKKSGGEGNRKQKGGDLPGAGAAGEGNGRIDGGRLSIRSWADAATKETVFKIHSKEEIRGDLALVAIGSDGRPDNSYNLPIEYVNLETSTGISEIQIAGNVLKDIRLRGPKHATELRIKFRNDRRFRLEVQ
ncbi:hypothetical protein WG915_09485 [Corynebacterium sp. H128]|uniref:hypothetical protein n=1 Tax=Corynebacterium sp. H128 TaxID=3133427 RepID=UPI0030B16D62